MRRETIVIVCVLAAVVLPMWYVAMHGEPPSEEIEIDQSVSAMRPLQEIVDTPNKLSPSQVGVIVWVALFALVGVLTAAHRFMNRAVRPPDGTDPTVGSATPGEGGDPATDGGTAGGPRTDGAGVRSPWLVTDERWLVEYHPASEDVTGIVAMGALTVLAIVFAALFTGEYLTLARTQYFGLYAAGMFLSLAGLTVAYYAWFLPHVQVAERRGH